MLDEVVPVAADQDIAAVFLGGGFFLKASMPHMTKVKRCKRL